MQKSSFFNAELVGETWDRTYTAEDYANYFGSFIGNGVFPNPSTNLQIVVNGDMTITVKEGKSWINGYMYHNDSDLILNVDPADGVLKRIDRVVVKLDFINREITCKVKKGTFASSPVAPSLQRDSDIHELGIADVLIDNGVISIVQSKITDTRLNTNLCGIVTQTVNEINTTELYNKLQGYIDEIGLNVQAWSDSATAQWSMDFNTWFSTVKNILSEDVAGNLANRILVLEDKVGNGLTADNITMANGSTVEASIASLKTNSGDLVNLQTGNKANLVAAINEAFQFANNGKTLIADSIIGKGITASTGDDFSVLAGKIDDMELEKHRVPPGVDYYMQYVTGQIPTPILDLGLSGVAEFKGNKIYAFTSTRYSICDLDLGVWIDKGVTPASWTCKQSSSVRIGDRIYSFTQAKSCYYDTLTDTFTQIYPPAFFIDQGARNFVSIGTDIYRVETTGLVKYDTLTNTYVSLTNLSGYNIGYNRYDNCLHICSYGDPFKIDKYDLETGVYTSSYWVSANPTLNISDTINRITFTEDVIGIHTRTYSHFYSKSKNVRIGSALATNTRTYACLVQNFDYDHVLYFLGGYESSTYYKFAGIASYIGF